MKICKDFINEFKFFIMNNTLTKKYYNKKYPHTKYSLNKIIQSIFYILRTGISWRDLNFGTHWNSVYFHFSRFCALNIFYKFFVSIRDKYLCGINKYVYIVDSTFIQNKSGKQFIGRNKFFKNKNCNKISLITDSVGVPLSIFIGSGNTHDIPLLKNHFNDLFIISKKHSITLLADKGYISKHLSHDLNSYSYKLMTPKKSNMKTNNTSYNPVLYKQRICVEHTFSHLKNFRRIQLRYDSSIQVYSSFVYLAFSILIFRKI